MDQNNQQNQEDTKAQSQAGGESSNNDTQAQSSQGSSTAQVSKPETTDVVVEKLKQALDKERTERKKLEDKIKQDNDRKLEDEKQFQELAEQRKQEVEGYKVKITEITKNSAIEKALLKTGLNSEALDFALFKIRSEVESDDAGNVTGLDQAVESFKNSNPLLFSLPQQANSNDNPPVVNKPAGQVGTNIATGGNQPTIDVTKLNDPNYVANNLEEVNKFVKSNKV